MFDPMDDIEAVSDDQEAARLRIEFEHTLRTNTQLTEPERDEYRAALAELDRRFPNAHAHSLHATETELYGPGGMPSGYRNTRATLRSEHGVTAASAAAARRRSSAPPRSSGSRRRSSRSGSGGFGGFGGTARQAASLSGADTLASGVGDTALAAVRLGLGLALAYFLLGPRGSKGFAGVLNAVSYGVRAFVAPVDPLNARQVAGELQRVPTRGDLNRAFGGQHFAPLPASAKRPVPTRHPVPTPSGAAIFGAPQLGEIPTG